MSIVVRHKILWIKNSVRVSAQKIYNNIVSNRLMKKCSPKPLKRVHFRKISVKDSERTHAEVVSMHSRELIIVRHMLELLRNVIQKSVIPSQTRLSVRIVMMLLYSNSRSQRRILTTVDRSSMRQSDSIVRQHW